MYKKADQADESEKEAEKNFLMNDKKIKKFNRQFNKSYELGHNKYSDKSFSQNKKLHTGLKIPGNITSTILRSFADISRRQRNMTLPKSRNYTNQMQPIKDQKG